MSDPAPRLNAKPPQTTPAHRKQLRALVREGVENRPGVYRMLGPTGTVIYVGQSRVLRTRLLSYFRAKGRRNKAARILRHAFHIEWEYTNTEFGALLRELRLIKQYRPHFNTMMVMDEWPRACAGPCIGAGHPLPYRKAADDVRLFLDGLSDAPVRLLETAMQQAADALAFEKAGVLRDRLELVRWLHERVQHFHANVDRLTFRYHAFGHAEAEWVYLIRRGTVRAEVRAPRTDEERAVFDALVTRVYEGADPGGADVPTHDLDEFYLVASWFRRRPEERKRAKSPRST
ncbi:MAG: hypothetical protein EBV77_10445 [Gemmatimonadaceae bacterium]|nr:hypothetical protein [Gemmatimonadaceae bacterium]